ncbi:MAG: hypothetical protein NDI90_15235 [Nitrospira sp. BO4]|jgi:hypothetical protein|nr:hypothetical protein [Nitrospira sp. BO4]
MKVSPFTLCVLTALVTGCALEQEVSRTSRTAVEQVLLTQAVEQALKNLTIRLPEGVHVDVDATGLDSAPSRPRMTNGEGGVIDRPSRDVLYIRDAVAAELGRQGYRISARDIAPYTVHVMAESFGTMQGMTFVGMPPVQSVLIPFSLPELTIYKNQSQSGYVRLHMDVVDNRTGEFLGTTAKLVGRAFYNQYTVLIFANWHRTDVTAPPFAGSE